MKEAAAEVLISDYDLYLFGEGKHTRIYEKLGAHPLTVDGVAGYHFAVWAPSAQRVSVVGDFNRWQGAHMHSVPWVRVGSGADSFRG